MLNVLIACEESQTICSSFRSVGLAAFSCDLQSPSGGLPEYHIKDDCLNVLNGGSFKTLNGDLFSIDKWDLIIAHPPCTYLSIASACRLYPVAGQLDYERYQKGLAAKDFFLKILNCDCHHLCIENPFPLKVFQMPMYSQIIQPFQFGEGFSKKTCLWLRGLPLLKPTNIITDYVPYVSSCTSHFKGRSDKSGFSRAGGSSRVRSRTFKGIAEAMVAQWGSYLLNLKDGEKNA